MQAQHTYKCKHSTPRSDCSYGNEASLRFPRTAPYSPQITAASKVPCTAVLCFMLRPPLHCRYCECFASGRYCEGCNCTNCCNNHENEAIRQSAVESILERNPNAFRPKIQVRAASILGTPADNSYLCGEKTVLHTMLLAREHMHFLAT